MALRKRKPDPTRRAQVQRKSIARAPLLGAHVSIAGGIDQAPARGRRAGCAVIQIFVKSTHQWQARPLDDKEVLAFRENLDKCRIRTAFGHDAYLPNLASPDRALRRRSIEALTEEVRRADRLGLPFLVVHPGAHMGRGERRGLERVAGSLDRVMDQTPGSPVKIALETTAGQGTSLGWRFEHLAAIIDRVADASRMGVCVDTCHVFAAGYDLTTAKRYSQVMKALDAAVGLDRVLALHLNDSRSGLGSRVDRHAHIGRGAMGLAPFRFVMNDRRFRAVPKVLETPKGKGVYLDRRNLGVLKGLVRKR